jgi:hypothetical protein
VTTTGGYNYYVQLDRELAAAYRRQQQNNPPPSPSRANHSSASSKANASSSSWRYLAFDRGEEAENQEDTRFQLTNSPKITHRSHWEHAKQNFERFGQRSEEAQRRANFGDIREQGNININMCSFFGQIFYLPLNH